MGDSVREEASDEEHILSDEDIRRRNQITEALPLETWKQCGGGEYRISKSNHSDYRTSNVFTPDP